ncbi:MAG: uroporphyrinogen-III synthase [Acidobacteria bacterium RIFCSPLOWO2_02_FULL_68_18]|nr:MAG: uroporphyrinogen-III synthase [Acidobacteria bacterium RIFCSPLOWO2_02_FULL_68_18]OFW51496.1 MAG: uroporphyrinogen-III synthase [Acidobacteria bacterium RIFCSPLOWO2_12_FULL_68_19]
MSARAPSFQGLSVLVLESRRSREMASLVSTYGGRPVVAPALREVPLESNSDALAFADALVRDEFDIVILLTGVGTRALLAVVDSARGREAFVAALARTRVVARGPKPLAVLRELQVPVWVRVPEPNTWRELVAAIDATGESILGRRVAVQEYGKSNDELLHELERRGARVTRVPVYRWALPDDVEPLRAAVSAVARGELDAALFTTGVQVVHFMEVAGNLGQADAVRDGLRRMVVASIGPTTTEALRNQGIAADLEASHPKMGLLVREAAERGPALLRRKRST